MPTSCQVLGRSPIAIAASTGTAPPVAPTGATTLIGPTRAAEKKVTRASALKTPAPMPNSSARVPGAPVPSTA